MYLDLCSRPESINLHHWSSLQLEVWQAVLEYSTNVWHLCWLSSGETLMDQQCHGWTAVLFFPTEVCNPLHSWCPFIPWTPNQKFSYPPRHLWSWAPYGAQQLTFYFSILSLNRSFCTVYSFCYSVYFPLYQKISPLFSCFPVHGGFLLYITFFCS